MVSYAIGGTASNGVDYLALPATVTIPAGQRKATIVVVPIDDSLPERIETVVLALRLPMDWPTNTLPPTLTPTVTSTPRPTFTPSS